MIKIIDDSVAEGNSLLATCRALEINPRSYYRWKKLPGPPRPRGGGGKNKILDEERIKILRLAKKRPELGSRQLAFTLEKKRTVFIGKTTVAKILKEEGLARAQGAKRADRRPEPSDELKFEPWAKNLVWGLDWTYLRVDNRFMYLLVIVDWYSRYIVGWSLHQSITKYEVTALITQACADQDIDGLLEGALRPMIVADHGSANVANYTKHNIEVQGLSLWLSGVGRPTGNARTERVIGTLKREEIYLQEQYSDYEEALKLIGAKIYSYNYHRPNSGNGGFAPASVHSIGRAPLLKIRMEGRQRAVKKRIKYRSGRSTMELT